MKTYVHVSKSYQVMPGGQEIMTSKGRTLVLGHNKAKRGKREKELRHREEVREWFAAQPADRDLTNFPGG